MEKDFDFNSVGKRLPYTVADEYFEKITKQTLLNARQRRRGRLFRRTIGIAASVIIICTVSLLYLTNSTNRDYTVDELISQMSDSELNTLMIINVSDVLLNEEL